MATVDFDVQGEWTLIGQGEGQVIVTAFGKDGRVVTAEDGVIPSFDPNRVGHVLPNRGNVTILLAAGEYLWLHGTGHFTVTRGF